MGRGLRNWVPISAVCALAALGCSGGTDAPLSSAGQSTYANTSFSPVTGTGASGEAAPEIWWRLRVNGGMPASIVSDGEPGTVRLDDIEVRIAAGLPVQRTTTLSGTVALGGADPSSTHLNETTIETLDVGPPSAVTRETSHIQEAIAASNGSGSLDLMAVVTTSVSLTQFGDRADLDQLPVGHVDDLSYMSTGSFTGTVSSNGMSQTSSNDEIDMVHETWTVAEQLPSMDVLGKTYTRVVKIERTLDTTNTATGVTTSTPSTLWLAAGIGLIHGISVQTDVPELAGVPTDLVDTNLRQ